MTKQNFGHTETMKGYTTKGDTMKGDRVKNTTLYIHPTF